MCATLTRIICRSRSRRRTNPKVEKDMSTETREDGMECACNVEMKGKYTLEHKWMECTYGRNALGGVEQGSTRSRYRCCATIVV